MVARTESPLNDAFPEVSGIWVVHLKTTEWSEYYHLSGRPLRAFASQHDAEVWAAEIKHKHCIGHSPFEYVWQDDTQTYMQHSQAMEATNISGLLDMPLLVFHDWLIDANIEPPPNIETLDGYGWNRWWKQNSKPWTANQHIAFWTPFSQASMLRVEEVSLAE